MTKLIQLAIDGGPPVKAPDQLISNIGEEESTAVKRMIDESGILSAFRGGEEVRKFEAAFANYVGTKHAIATTSGTTALHTSVASLNLNSEDEVLVPAMTFVSTASVVLQEKAQVVFVDVDETYCIDPSDLVSKITPRSKAIIPVHLYGQPVEIGKIRDIAKAHDLVVVEDACQSHGAIYRGKKTGTLGDMGCFSFFQTKNMTTGEGGMITTSNDNLYQKLRLLREHGSSSQSTTWYNYGSLGYNYNMTEMQGAIGLVQLSKLDEMNQVRIDNAKYYDYHLQNLDLTLPKTRPDVTHVWHNYPVLLPEHLASHRDFFVNALRAEGIAVDVAYPKALYDTELFRNLNVTGHCPNSENYSSRLFTLFTDMSINEPAIICTRRAIEKVLAYLKETA